jgi:hypothetical protein
VGVLETDPTTAHLFVKVTNISPRRELEITHIWLETDQGRTSSTIQPGPLRPG